MRGRGENEVGEAGKGQSMLGLAKHDQELDFIVGMMGSAQEV